MEVLVQRDKHTKYDLYIISCKDQELQQGEVYRHTKTSGFYDRPRATCPQSFEFLGKNCAARIPIRHNISTTGIIKNHKPPSFSCSLITHRDIYDESPAFNTNIV